MNHLRMIFGMLISIALQSNSPINVGQLQEAPNKNIRVAVDIACTVRGSAPLGYFVIPLRRNEWASLLSDNDLGPFLLAAAKQTDSLVLLIPAHPDDAPTIAVYFKADTPTGISIIPPKIKKLTQQLVASKRQRIPEAIHSCACDLSYELGSLTADNGTPVHSYEISGSKL